MRQPNSNERLELERELQRLASAIDDKDLRALVLIASTVSSRGKKQSPVLSTATEQTPWEAL